MISVKKYRATTTREALEMIKQDLGEDAFVLDTKRVRAGGFLGFRSTEQIEVSAAAASFSQKEPARSKAKPVFRSNRSLDLRDDAPARPTSPGPSPTYQNKQLFPALSEHAASSAKIKPDVPAETQERKEQKIDAVEISTEAPRLIHPRLDSSSQNLAEPTFAAVPNPVENNSIPSRDRDLDLLRAEVREVKFTLGAFANRKSSQAWQSGVDVDLFGEIFEQPFYDVYTQLTGTGISLELARKFVADSIPQFKNDIGNIELLARTMLNRSISSMVRFEPDPLQGRDASVLAMIGATGVGKTTTIAKLAARVALQVCRRVELVTLDTYRIAAVEQLKIYAEIIGAGCHVVRTAFELDSVLRRLSPEATVLIDTTGRNPHDLADQFEISDFLRQRPDIHKCLAIQATTHPMDASVAIKKFEMYGADSLVITKMDETMRPGAVIETIAESDLPLAYICGGQRVPEDLQVATVSSLTNQILGGAA